MQKVLKVANTGKFRVCTGLCEGISTSSEMQCGSAQSGDVRQCTGN